MGDDADNAASGVEFSGHADGVEGLDFVQATLGLNIFLHQFIGSLGGSGNSRSKKNCSHN